MTKIVTKDKEFALTSFQNEDELEKVVVENYTKIFGNNTYYFNLKKGIKHKPGDLLTIPDGYLLRFNRKPSLIIIENELSTHDKIQHIGAQFLKFNSALTDTSKYHVKKFLTDYLKENSKEEQKVNKLLPETPYKTYSDLLDAVVMEQTMDFAIIIDGTNEELERVLSPFHPEIIVLKKFQSKDNEIVYHVELDSPTPVVQINNSNKNEMRNSPEIDTIVCSALEDGFNEVFLKEHRWFPIRISPSKILKIKYLAMYESAPVSAINYIGEVKQIKTYKNTGKYEVVLTGPPRKLDTQIKLSDENPNIAPQSPKYTISSLFEGATKLEDIFPQ